MKTKEQVQQEVTAKLQTQQETTPQSQAQTVMASSYAAMTTSNATTMLSTAQVCVNNNLEYHQLWEGDGNEENI